MIFSQCPVRAAERAARAFLMPTRARDDLPGLLDVASDAGNGIAASQGQGDKDQSGDGFHFGHSLFFY
jgi:hypothetical protein